MAIGTTRTTADLRTTTRIPSPGAKRGGCTGCGAPAGGHCSCSDACLPCGCGELACLCRPNWFAGMVLRDEDLRRLDTYIVERFRRVNLQFFGPGVVNGLEVRCDPCGSGVVVGCGHAISPCGDDIVVCDDAYVDVCKLIAKCRQNERDECLPHQRPRACPDLEQKWVLAIEFAERPERGVLPLRRESSAKECGCGCGGHSGGGCTCEGGATGWSGSSTKGAASSDRPRAAPPSCEPTLLCEDFRFRVCPSPDLPPACRTGNDTDRADGELGDMLERMKCCMDALMQNLPTAPELNTQEPDQSILQRSDEWYRWFCLIKQHLLNFVSRYPTANCEAVADLQKLACLRRSDFSSSEAYLAYWRETVERLAIIFVELLFSCICSGLLPPCPEPAISTSIPLATVTVSHAGGSCRVVSVCNWTRLRKYSANLRTLNYWLSFLPFGRDLHRLLECICCDLLADIFEDDDQRRDPVGGSTGTPAAGGVDPTVDERRGTAGPTGDGTAGIGGDTGDNFGADGGDDGTGPATGPVRGNAVLRERLNRRLRPQADSGAFDRLASTARAVFRSAGPVEPMAALGDLLGWSPAKEPGPFGEAGRSSTAEALIFNSLAAPIIRGLANSPGLDNFALDLGAGKGSLSAYPKSDAAGSTDELQSMRTEIAELRARLDGLEGGSDRER